MLTQWPISTLLLTHEIRAVALGVDNVLLGYPNASSPLGPNTRPNLYSRSTLITASDPLFAAITGQKAARSGRTLPPFLMHEPPDYFISELPAEQRLYEGFVGSEEASEALKRLKDDGIRLALWDNVHVAGAAQVHSLIDSFYPETFPRDHRLFSSDLHQAIGDDNFLEALRGRLQVPIECILFVMADRGTANHLLQRGLKSCFFKLFSEERADSLSLSLFSYLGGDGRLKDPALFSDAMGRLRAAQGGNISPPNQTLTAGEKENVHLIMDQVLAHSGSRRLESMVRALLIDEILWRGFSGTPPLAPKMTAALAVPRFLSLENVRREALGFVNGYLEQVERGLPGLAQASITGLLEELEALFRSHEGFLRQTGVVADVGSRIRRHIEDNHDLYVHRTQVLHEEEWTTLVRVFHEDDQALDIRFQEWVNLTYHKEREMAAANVAAEDIRKYVKERLVDDLILRVMELEMRDRSLQKGIQRSVLFPNLHDTRNRITTLTEGINDRKFWKAVMIEQTTTLDRWVRSLTARMKHMAQRHQVKLTFSVHTEAGLPPMELRDLSESAREALDHILTELMMNAVKYRRTDTPPEARIRVTLFESERAMMITVADNGIGIKDPENIWAAGVRERPDLAEGMGAGLSSVKHHVDAQKWTIALESHPEEGSTFTLTVPVKISSTPPKT